MRRYNLLKESDIVPNNYYVGIVYYPCVSPNRSPMEDTIFVDKYRNFYGISKCIETLVEDDVISVLFDYDPERAYEIIQGGYVEDGKYNDLLKGYDFQLQKKLNKYLESKEIENE